jgi:hypothetical protein
MRSLGQFAREEELQQMLHEVDIDGTCLRAQQSHSNRQKLAVTQRGKIFPAFYETPKFITVHIKRPAHSL